jgi:indole-3-glycerol phosphate synthase
VNARDLSTFAPTAICSAARATIPGRRDQDRGVRRPSHPADVAHYRAAGADVVLIGEALVTGDPVATLTAFLGAGAGDVISERSESK